jgi:hypothetical protein
MTEKQQTCPINIPFLDGKVVNRQWVSWFQRLRTADDTIIQFKHYILTSDTTLTERHLGKVIHFEVGTSSITCTLPHISTKDMYSWIEIYRLGTGRLTVSANDSDKIERSSYGGKIFCEEVERFAANLRLMIIRENIWAITGGTGIWKVV